MAAIWFISLEWLKQINHSLGFELQTWNKSIKWCEGFYFFNDRNLVLGDTSETQPYASDNSVAIMVIFLVLDQIVSLSLGWIDDPPTLWRYHLTGGQVND